MYPFSFKTIDFELVSPPYMQENETDPTLINMICKYKHPHIALNSCVMYVLDRYSGSVVDVHLGKFNDFDENVSPRVCPPLLSSEEVKHVYWDWYKSLRAHSKNTPLDIRIRIERNNILHRLHKESYKDVIKANAFEISRLDPDLALITMYVKELSKEMLNYNASRFNNNELDKLTSFINTTLIKLSGSWNSIHIDTDTIYLVPISVILNHDGEYNNRIIVLFRVSGPGTDIFCARIQGYTNKYEVDNMDNLVYILDLVANEY